MDRDRLTPKLTTSDIYYVHATEGFYDTVAGDRLSAEAVDAAVGFVAVRRTGEKVKEGQSWELEGLKCSTLVPASKWIMGRRAVSSITGENFMLPAQDRLKIVVKGVRVIGFDAVFCKNATTLNLSQEALDARAKFLLFEEEYGV